MGIRLITDWAECYHQSANLLRNDKPAFLSRIGGSDTFVVAEYLRIKTGGSDDYADLLKWRSLVEQYNGFYDKTHSDRPLLDYCETMFRAYLSSRYLIFCNYQLLAMYFPGSIHPSFLDRPIEKRESLKLLIDIIDAESTKIGLDVPCYPYPYVERMTMDPFTLFRVFAETLVAKKVLVICPFAKSIEMNWPNRAKFFKDYEYPNFDLMLCNTPITYGGLPEHFYPHDNWHATLRALECQIEIIDFDVALLACGSYALPLGVFVEQRLRRKAVYVGGVLQMYFGILGRRYDNEFYTHQINRDEFIWPVERSDILRHVEINKHAAHEAVGAYF